MLPRELQSVTWEGVRGLFPAAFKQGQNVTDIENIWNQYKRGGMSIAQARDAVYGRAGGIDTPDWAGGAPSGGGALSTYKTETPAPGRLAQGTGQAGFVDPRMLRWLATLGAGGYVASGMLEDDVEESDVADRFRRKIVE